MCERKRILYLIVGPMLFVAATAFLHGPFGVSGAETIGLLLWMVFWWITCPVHMTVTAFIPIIANSLLNIIPMNQIISQYFSDSAILIFCAALLTTPWKAAGFDRRIALKALSIIGPSIKSQIAVWLLLSMALSVVLPNIAVCALLTPIAVIMLQAVGFEEVGKAEPAVPILLCIGWGVGLGGACSPLGGGMNIAAISFLEEYYGHEFMYVDWLIRMGPFCVITGVVMMVTMQIMHRKISPLNGTKEYFQESYKELGPMKKDEKICAALFILALLGVFLRPLFAQALPALAPAYWLMILGSVSFFINIRGKGIMMSWEEAQENTLWGMMLLFGGGLALGRLVNESGAGASIAKLVCALNLTGELPIIMIITVFAVFMSETTNSTVSAAVVVPIVLSITAQNGLNPIPYWFISLMALNSEFLLPISVRAIPVGYGLDPKIMMKRGIPMLLIRMLIVIVVGYICMEFWPTFNSIPYMVK